MPRQTKTLGHFLIFGEFLKGFALIEPSPLSASIGSERVTCHYFYEAVGNLPVALEVHFVSQMISSPRAALISEVQQVRWSRSKAVGAKIVRKRLHKKAQSSEGFVELLR